jgi:hypothetical protein
MARYEEVLKLLKAGNSPAEIARQCRISLQAVAQYLYTAVGRKIISRSDILFTMDEETVQAVEWAIDNHSIRNRYELHNLLRAEAENRDQLDEDLLYFDLREAPLADMYEVLCRSERFLHTYIKLTTEKLSGPEGFWRQLPLSVREECVVNREQDEFPQDDPYSYTTFIHLKVIFDKNWLTLREGLPKSVAADKKLFLSCLQELNSIRNRVMHPVRGYKPSSRDFAYVSDFAQAMFGEGVHAQD